MMHHWVSLEKSTEPAWSRHVDRWYQLDEVSFAFCEALSHWKNLSEYQKPDVILLALPGASNLADQDFAASGAHSPAKFVYTLPNVCVAVIFQMLGFGGKVYCLHQGNKTFEFALNEAKEMAKKNKTVWVLSSSPVLENNSRRVSFHCETGAPASI